MKSLLLMLLLFPVQKNQIADIRNHVYYTNIHLNLYKQKQLSHADGQSTEGGMSVAYYAKDTLKLIMDNTYWETGKEMAQYYFQDDALIFAYIITLKYNVPIYDKDFDYNKSKKNEERYYYVNKKIIKGKDNGKELIETARELAASFPRP
ncbi:hypothetical protein SAMN05444266_11187 [Chitinophaga jiangningensis]|uniref:Uncharacterized protein n=1 Tax=Chitinophaga jiangningensis TaxID=1419482 RepID=A0A1M7LQX1_9BACT|nr:hypothetical protein [Chitinophaga jiangningensis]SHM80434.1 hypothetical protein SAMN05444266_11187 [Chitinophaga jiangningensis]